MNWHHVYWWTWPAAIVIGFAWSFVLMCVTPPRITAREFFRNWKALFRLATAPLHAIRAAKGNGDA